MARWLQRLTDYSVPVKEHHQDAIGWDTCAVGEVVEDFPQVVLARYGRPSRSTPPVDERLERLGSQFARKIGKDDRRGALAIYDRIQARVRILLRQAGRRVV